MGEHYPAASDANADSYRYSHPHANTDIFAFDVPLCLARSLPCANLRLSSSIGEHHPFADTDHHGHTFSFRESVTQAKPHAESERPP